ncbi:phage tail P2-like protein [Raoultella sp. BIGb0138]|uniref:phage tail protein I n=1 Tax=Raoultella sp. BIGb0138 TaxID=2485115 RepID=UPI001047E891|nr:phage tail protein I [Raoultella sp. BIGb0138]TCW05620.1 phage tail P2-like protein [Raoultella sp. BIGb0138]
MNNSLLPPGSSALERRLAQACSGISDLNVPLRDLWNPWKCPAKFLPYLAWAFSVDRYEETWTENAKRQAVSDAFWIHQRKGTVAAVKRVIEGFGYSMALDEWWEVADPAGTFRLSVDLNEIGITEAMLKELERLINETKPVSRHLARLDVISRTSGNIYMGAALYTGDIVTIYPPDYQADDSLHYNGLVSFDGNYLFSGEDDGNN